MKSLIIFVLVTILFPIGCNHSHSNEENATSESLESHEDEISFTKEQEKNAGLKYGIVEQKNIQSNVKLIGRVELPPTGRIIVGSKLEGEILDVHIIEGQRIKKGQKVFTLQNLDLIEWKEEWLGLFSKIEYLDIEIERQKLLVEEQLAPLKNYESLVSERNQAMFKIKSIEAKFDAIGKPLERDENFNSIFNLRAQSGGILQKLIASKGQFIERGAKLAEIIDNHHLHIHLAVYSDDVGKLDVGQEIVFNVQSNPDEIFKASIKWIDAFVNMENNSYQVHAEIESDDHHFAVGEFVEARVVNTESTVSALPESAIIQDNGLSYIFIKVEEHDDEIHFLKYQVKQGVKDMGFVEVVPIDEFSHDAQVVTAGAFFLLAQSKKGTEASSHSHSH